MAYYGSSFHEAGFGGEYYTTPSYAYAPSYDIVPFQDPVSYSNDYEHYYPASYSTSAYYDPFATHSEINHSMYRASEPLLIEYNPISSYTNHFSSDTQYIISYSTATAEVDDTHYEDYDPTPYDGGYDPTLTYGKPLPPSTDICYPRSSPVSANSLPPDKVSYGSIPSPYGVGDVKELPEKPSKVAEPIKSNVEQKPEPEPDEGIGDSDSEVESDISIQPVDEPDSRAGYGYGVGVIEQAPRVPYGSGLEAMDLCETLFGYWPCLEKQKRMNNGSQGVGNEEHDQQKQWRCAADYLFGRSPSGYGGFEGGSYWEPNCNYERHYQRENHIQVENSWLLNSSIVYSQHDSSSSSSSSSSW